MSEIKINKFKKVLQEKGTCQYGIWNGLADAYVGEILAGAGFDWVLIDAEHAPYDLRSILNQLQVMESFGVPVIVRPPIGSVDLVKQYLELGIQTLLVPMIENAEQAELMYKAMQYPPVGLRGVGTALARASQWNRVNNYFAHAGKEMCLIVQVESVEGIKNLDQILSVQGIDGVFIGPADLAASMGFLGQPDKAEVKTEVEKALRKIRGANKIAGVMAIAKPLAEHYEKCGANMIALAVDTLLLAKATTDLIKTFKSNEQNTSNTKY